MGGKGASKRGGGNANSGGIFDSRRGRREPCADFFREGGDGGELRTEHGPVGVFEVEADVAGGEVGSGEGFAERENLGQQVGIAIREMAAELDQVVGLLKSPPETHQLGFESLFEDLGEFAAAEFVAEFASGENVKSGEVGLDEIQPIGGVLDFSLARQGALLG